MYKCIIGVLLMLVVSCKSKTDEKLCFDGWSVMMGYRYLEYSEGANTLLFIIEPMYSGPDLIYVPNNDVWIKTKPEWIQNDLSVIKSHITSVNWNRDLTWYETNSPVDIGSNTVIEGTIEATEGGIQLEKMRLFNPDKNITPQQARETWIEAVKSYTDSLEGEVVAFDDGYIKNSVYDKIILPRLTNNKKVKIIHK